MLYVECKYAMSLEYVLRPCTFCPLSAAPSRGYADMSSIKIVHLIVNRRKYRKEKN